MSQPVFHAPDHDHERCTADALAHAETLCAQRSQRLTPIRRQVLEVLLESHKPLGAYEIMDRAAGGAARRPGADHDLSRARFSPRQRPRASHREPQRLRRLRQQSRHRRSRGVPDLRALRRGRRGAVGGGRRSAQGRRARRGLHAEGAGDRDRRRLRALPAARSQLECPQIPASHTRPLDAASMALVVFICFTWGFNQPAIKLAIHDVPPLMQCAIRSSLATLMVLGLMRLRGLPVTARDGTLAAGPHRRRAVRLRVPADLSRAALHHGVARGAVHLSRAVLRGDRRALVLSRRPLRLDAVARPADGLRRHGGGLRRAGAGVVAAPAARRSDDGRRGAGLGRDHAGHQGERARPRLAGKDAALSARGLRARSWRSARSSSASGSQPCRRRWRSARSPIRPSWSARPSACGSR